jgi:hypothetical protein
VLRIKYDPVQQAALALEREIQREMSPQAKYA